MYYSFYIQGAAVPTGYTPFFACGYACFRLFVPPVYAICLQRLSRCHRLPWENLCLRKSERYLFRSVLPLAHNFQQVIKYFYQ